MKNKILLLALASLFAMQASASLFKIVGRRAIPTKKLTLLAMAQRYLLKTHLKEITKNIHAKQTRLKDVPFLSYSDFVNEVWDLKLKISELEDQALAIKAQLAKK